MIEDGWVSGRVELCSRGLTDAPAGHVEDFAAAARRACAVVLMSASRSLHLEKASPPSVSIDRNPCSHSPARSCIICSFR